MSENKTPKAKNMMYAQQVRHLPPGITTPEDLAQLIEDRLNPAKFAIIVHDQELDEQGQPREPDIHAMMSFQNARHCSAVAKKLGDKPQYVQAWTGNSNNGYAYLVHATDKARREGKHQYDPAEVKANFDFPAMMADIRGEIAQAKTEHQSTANIKTMLDLLYTGAVTKDEIERQLSGAQYARYHRQIADVDAKRLVREAEKWRAEMQEKNAQIRVIWLTGPGGTGKTSLAKELAKKRGQPYFISGSSRDIFQAYNGEHTLILDELRPQVLTYADLLRITDPFGLEHGVMAPCRYNDKMLACDLIIITTPFTPSDFYYRQFGLETADAFKKDCPDGIGQLVRRISVTVEMSGKKIEAMEYDAGHFRYVPIPGTARANPYSGLARRDSVPDPVNIYNSMFDD